MIQEFENKEKFLKDSWEREDGYGKGLSCVLQDGETFDKAGVNQTSLLMPFSEQMAKYMSSRGKVYNHPNTDLLMYVSGVSLVIHPKNPFAPTVHANYRYFEIENIRTNEIIDCWFGGGTDLTPSYLFNEDAKEFHQKQKIACDSVQSQDENIYPKFKKICDEYFVNTHRGNESRGIGGIFYDDLIIDGDWDKTFLLAKSSSHGLLSAYKDILERRVNMPYNEKNEIWRDIRRGRYVEFNLIHDRGTKFGLQTKDARIESILMSLPLKARWEYMFKIEKDSEEEKLVNILKNPINWI